MIHIIILELNISIINSFILKTPIKLTIIKKLLSIIFLNSEYIKSYSYFNIFSDIDKLIKIIVTLMFFIFIIVISYISETY